jgi:predicted RNase H-like nuclease (RuvC/YqgF family)
LLHISINDREQKWFDPFPEPHTQESNYDKYKKERKVYKERCARQEEEIHDLRLQITENAQIVERTKQSAKQIQAELENKEFFLGRQGTDEEIQHQLDSLLSSIKTWSTKFMAKGVVIALDENRISEYLHIAPSYLPGSLKELEKALSKDRKKRRLFVRGLAAYKMSLLFRTLDIDSKHSKPEIDTWLEGGLANSFADIETRLYLAGRLLIFKLNMSSSLN